jgi:hypothetical protein
LKTIRAQIGLVIIIILGSLILFQACKKEPDQVGVGIRPEDDIVNVFNQDTSSIMAYTVREDSTKTDETQLNLLGSYWDPVFGKTTATLYTQIRLSENGYDFGDNPVLDSIVLTMDYSSYYGDTNDQIQLRIYQLSESIFQDSVYYSTNSVDFDPVELASLSLFPRPNSPVVAGGDTVLPQLRIRLSDDFGNAILNAPSSAFIDNDNWLEFFKGFAMVPEETSSTGSILSFDLLSDISRMVLYYSNDEQDSLDFVFLINDNCARFMNYEHYGYVHADASLQQQVLEGDTELGNKRLYLQAMGGLKVKIMFPHIKSIVANGNIAINDAKLVINDYQDEEEFTPPNRLVVVGINEQGKNYIIPDQFELYYGGFYDSTKNQVIFRITRYIQSLLEEGAQDYGLHLLVASASLVPNRQIINGAMPDPPVPYSKRFKLNITYTPVE